MVGGTSALANGMLASVVGLEAAIVPVIVILGGLLAGGFVAGIYCRRRSRRFVGRLGLLAPAPLPFSHFLSAVTRAASQHEHHGSTPVQYSILAAPKRPAGRAEPGA